MTIIKSSYLRLALAALMAAGLAACVTPPVTDDSIKIQRLIFLNNTSNALNNVRIYISNTSEFASCGYILPKTECSTGFRLREYKGNRFDVSWQENGHSRKVENILAQQPTELIAGKNLNAVIVFGAQGQFSAQLKY